MLSTKKKITAALTLAIAGTFALSACSMGSTTAEPSSEPSATMEATPEAMEMDPAANLVGPACAAYAEANPTGGGSIQGMSQDPVAVAASNNPMLTTLVSAVSGQLNPDVNLVDTLNGGEFTVFAPVDDAFAKVAPATIDTLKTDSALLTKVLTYHVVAGKYDAAALSKMIADGKGMASLQTVAGGTLTAKASGNAVMVTDEKGGTATVTIADVYQSNGVIHVVDKVLLPK